MRKINEKQKDITIKVLRSLNLIKKVNRFRMHNFQRKQQISTGKTMKSKSLRIYMKASMKYLSMVISLMLKKTKYLQISLNYLANQEDYPKLFLCLQVINKNGQKEYLIVKLLKNNMNKSNKKEDYKKKKKKKKHVKKLQKQVNNITNQRNKNKILKYLNLNK